MKPDNSNPLVSIISINYNRLDDTIELFDSIRQNDYSNIELILVDNGSDKNPDTIKSSFPQLQLIKNKRNLGFAAANNIGIKHAKGKYILLINNDMVVSPGFLSPLVQKLESENIIGIVSPKIYFHNNPNIIQYAGFTNIHPITIRNKGIGFKEADKGQYDQSVATYYAHGAACLFRASLIEKVGYMSEEFFLYYEEMDWCKRARNHGFKIFYVPQSVVYHKDSLTIGYESPIKTYYLNRGRLIYMRRNVKFPLLIVSSLYQLLFAFPKNYILFLIQKKRSHAKSYRNAYGWFIAHFFDKNLLVNKF